MNENPRNITPLMKLHLMAKNTERMSDDVTSMAEQVIYVEISEQPENQHLFLDKTSSHLNFMKLEYLK